MVKIDGSPAGFVNGWLMRELHAKDGAVGVGLFRIAERRWLAHLQPRKALRKAA